MKNPKMSKNIYSQKVWPTLFQSVSRTIERQRAFKNLRENDDRETTVITIGTIDGRLRTFCETEVVNLR
jgi:hypothetical protein